MKRCISPDDDKAPPFEMYSKIRWLVRRKVLFKFLINWKELQAYFMVTDPGSTQSAPYQLRSEAGPKEMQKELLAHGNGLREKVFDGQRRPWAITKVNFGRKFEFVAAKYVSVQSNKLVAKPKVLEIKQAMPRIPS